MIRLYEELSLNALPSLQTQFYDGWVLRFTNGYSYTNRANSVNLLYPSALDAQEKIAECEKRYFAQGLPAVFKITDGTDIEIDKRLDQAGYTILNPTYIMTAELKAFQNISDNCILTSHINNKWLDAYFSLSKYTDEMKISIAKQIFNNIKQEVLCGLIIKNGVTVACGMCVIERGYAGLFNIVVDESQRGNGYGTEICKSLLSEAKNLGAHTTYLQVMRENRTAINLYTKLGFNTLYSYWYRIKKEMS
ncbi:MAG: GNAT family N-acetyltransferase [Oscillospiraceae bacterium]|nr:GNAT family N-acetyltransferase [Oscillospiraceae bacterium]